MTLIHHMDMSYYHMKLPLWLDTYVNKCGMEYSLAYRSEVTKYKSVYSLGNYVLKCCIVSSLHTWDIVHVLHNLNGSSSDNYNYYLHTAGNSCPADRISTAPDHSIAAHCSFAGF